MENFSCSSYPESGNSSPRSREIECENQSWDEPSSMNVANNANYKANGGPEVCFKYQLPGEDLDALISVTNDEDLEHMMMEYDRSHRASAKPARLRLFLFPLNPPLVAPGFKGNDPKSDRKWFIDALNSVQIQNLDATSHPAVAMTPANPDFLYDLDKVKVPDSVPPPATAIAQEVVVKDVTVGSDCGSKDRHVIADPMMSPAAVQRLTHELQKMHISATQEQGIRQRKVDESNARAYNTQDYPQMSDKIAPSPAIVSAPLQMPIQTTFLTNAAYPVPAAATAPSGNQPVYLIPAPSAGVYQQPPTIRQVTIPGGYVQVAYDGAGRQVYFTAAPYQAMPPGTPAGGVSALNHDGKVAVNAKVPPQTSSV
ncbi:putative Oxidoreductase, zinc-binding dehydrogenase family protein [Hibiscus syriacus]|uniref:Oxidoreductase, zinc-binding dehydrogenase family protein n=1 Tax=Hibiscus syriacus TaxID=106335 RepID=A0A6A2XAT8_HIBSY|nr:putative Oxidoreductase, zinc-binding dehydrogenase family protein [Hibiscus syriacus]